MTKLKITSIVFLLISYSAAKAQGVLKKLENRVKDRTENRTERKVDQTVDKVLDRVFGDKPDGGASEPEDEEIADDNAYENENVSSEGIDLSDILSKRLGDDCQAKDAYTFDGNVVMKYVATEKKGKKTEEMSMRMHFTKDGSATAIVYLENTMGLEAESSIVVVDMDDSLTVMNMTVSGQSINMCTDIRESMLSTAQNSSGFSDDDAAAWTKTGKTKTILGYLCQEYIQEEQGNRTTAWVTEEIDNFMIGAGPSTRSGPVSTMKLPDNVPMGYPLETTILSSDGNSVTIITTEINQTESTTLSLSN